MNRTDSELQLQEEAARMEGEGQAMNPQVGRGQEKVVSSARVNPNVPLDKNIKHLKKMVPDASVSSSSLEKQKDVQRDL